jgi:uncharacterized protein YfiM (DUF2279 family)
MEGFSRGWSFLQQAWQMVFKDRDLIKPSIYALIAGLIISAAGLLPIVGAFILLGDSRFGNIVLFALGAILVFVQFVVSYVFSAMTVYLIYGYLAEGDGRMDKAWTIVRRDFRDIATLAAASTAVNMARSFVNRRARRGSFGANAARAAAGLFETLWTEAAFLVLPAMVIDDLNLKDGLGRVWKITQENLLLIGISTVGVRWVTRLIAFAFGATGLLLGVGLFYGLTALLGFEAIGPAVGIGLAVLSASAFMMTGAIIGSYTSTAYHTCLYLWARDVEKARAEGKAIAVAAPAPLAAALG